MFSLKSKQPLQSARFWAAAALFLLAAGCVQTKERSTAEIITVDPSLTYDRGLQKAMARARKAVRDTPDDPAPHYLLGQAYLMQNDPKAAEAEFRTLLALSPDSAGAYYELGRISARRGRYEVALAQLNRAVQLKPTFADAHFALARLHEKLGDFQKASAHSTAYIEALELQQREDKKPRSP